MNKINYYDIYEALYKMKYGMSSPYSDEGVTYMIEGKLYEKVFQEYLPVSTDVLQHVNVYDVSRQMYQYRTRGMFDHSVTPLVPFPEVVDAEYNADGTITLIVNAVSEKDEILHQDFKKFDIGAVCEECAGRSDGGHVS